MIGWLIKLFFSKAWAFVVMLAGYAKVHRLPLIGGVIIGLGTVAAQQVIKIDASFLLNQTLLDSFCAAYGICLTIAQGQETLLSILVAVVAAYALERVYRAKCGKYPAIVKAEVKIDKAMDKMGIADAFDAEHKADEEKING